MKHDDQVQHLAHEATAYRSAGLQLAEAASHVVREYDGIHRLAQAVADWYGTIANEGGRPHPTAGQDVRPAQSDLDRLRAQRDEARAVVDRMAERVRKARADMDEIRSERDEARAVVERQEGQIRRLARLARSRLEDLDRYHRWRDEWCDLAHQASKERDEFRDALHRVVNPPGFGSGVAERKAARELLRATKPTVVRPAEDPA